MNTQQFENKRVEFGASGFDNPVEDNEPIPSLPDDPDLEFCILRMGWALKRKVMQRSRLTENQRKYLTEVFLMGEQTGRKADPNEVSRAMRRARNIDGSSMFQSNDYLTPLQITSFFSRQSSKKSKSAAQADDNIDDCAAEEIAIEEMRNKVMSEIGITHPITYDTYNICDIVSSGHISKFSIRMLQVICSHFEIDTSKIKTTRKKGYLELITNLAKSCTCHS